jgi:hypothetical protein
MKFLNTLFGSFLLATLNVATASPTAVDPSLRTMEISSHMSQTEQKVRNAAVRVITSRDGHGSGSLIQYKDFQLVLTAQHIADEVIGTRYAVMHKNEIRAAVLIYANDNHDLAVLWVEQPWPRGIALKWNPTSDVATVGTRITYSGYPASHSLMTYRGRVAGYELARDGTTHILLHTYGYYGCSGSVIYNADGEIVGILWGIDQGRREVPVEDMIWVSPIQHLNLDLALRGLCETLSDEPRACR